jgi:predicted small metal-binding protein
MVTLKCPMCGLEFTADTEEEAKKMLIEHRKENHDKEKK